MLLILAAAALPAWFGVSAALSPFSWRERDWNDDGTTTVREYLYAIELGARPAACPGGKPGTEYFRLKDALPEKVDCGTPWRWGARTTVF